MNERFLQQTHFIGVIPPLELIQTLEECRSYMQANYGCKSGFGTPIHITLIPPFAFDQRQATEKLIGCVREAAEELLKNSRLPFQISVNGFNAFGDRTIFAHVAPSKQWTDLRDEIYSAIKRQFPEAPVKKDSRPFQPHLTVANRDIPPGKSVEALEYFSSLSLDSAFMIDNISLFTKNRFRWVSLPENSVHF